VRQRFLVVLPFHENRNRYNEWIMCLKGTSGDEDACKGVRQMAHSICPDEWVSLWDEQREENSFAGIKYGDDEH
jgi:hypothetical protein